MPGRAGWEAQEQDLLPVRGDVREPVHLLVEGQLLQIGPVGAETGDLCVSGDIREQLCVAVDPLAIWGEFASVERLRLVGERRSAPPAAGIKKMLARAHQSSPSGSSPM